MRHQPTTMVGEQEFLLCCAAVPNDAAARKKLTSLAGRALDWSYVLATAEAHGMLPLVRARVEEICPNRVPAGVRASLLRAYLRNAGRNLALTGELLRILEYLRAEGIEAVPFKGPALAEHLFSNVAMRQFCDLDILVRPEDVIRAREALLKHGYQPEFVLSPKREAEYIRSEHAFQLRKEEGAIVLELHWSFGSKDQAFPLAATDVWKRLKTGSVQGREVKALSQEDLFLYLCMHGAKHKWQRLEWIRSVAELARRQPEMNWEAVVSIARRTGAQRGLHIALLLTKDMCGLPLPPALAERVMADGKARELAGHVRAAIFYPPPTHRAREFQRHAFYLRSRERLADRVRIILFSSARIPHPLARDWDLFHLPSSMSFLYYLLRPLRLFREYGLRILQG